MTLWNGGTEVCGICGKTKPNNGEPCLACDAKHSLVLALEILSDKSSSRTMKKFARDLIAYAKRHGVKESG